MTTATQEKTERLQFIDWCLRFLGEARKPDLCARFGISSAAATRDFSAYKSQFPGSMKLHMSSKTYRPTPHYRPRYEFSLNDIFERLDKHGLTGGAQPLPPTQRLPMPAAPDAAVIAALTRAIYQKQTVRIAYLSPRSGGQKRDIVPFALACNALRWHARAYDLRRARFADFVLGRIEAAAATNAPPPPDADMANDADWHDIITLHLCPHPGNIRHPDAIEREYGMTDHKLRLRVRAALAGYLLRAWNVDCTRDHSLRGACYQLWLANARSVEKTDSMQLAPGLMDDNGGGA